MDPRDISAYPELGKKEASKVLSYKLAELSDLQRRLWADGSRSLLVVLQAMDTGGKDGTIRNVFTGVNPQGVDVHGFTEPSALERSHNYLWRVHYRTPAAGRIAIFNRSHYEDVLVVRVRGLEPDDVWGRRYEHIKAFEKMLNDEGTKIVKIMLNISKDEQRERLLARLLDPAKNFKFHPSDLDSRAQWDTYMEAYQDAIAKTSTEDSPWFVVPADRKWYRNLVVASILVDSLKAMELSYPEAAPGIASLTIQ